MTTNNSEYQRKYMKSYINTNYGFYSTKITNMKRSFKANNKNVDSSRLTLTTNEFIKIIIRFSGKCAYCGTSTDKLIPSMVVRFSHGGNLEFSNTLCACKACSKSKLDRTRLPQSSFEEWYKVQPFYSKERYDKIIQHVNNTSQNCNSEFESILIE